MLTTRAVVSMVGPVTLGVASTAALAGGVEERSIVNSGTFWSSAWAIGIFLVLFVVLSRMVWRPTMRVLREREHLIETHLAQAEAHRLDSERTLARYQAELADMENTVATRLHQAAEQAEKARQEILAAARRQAEEIARGAAEELDTARRAAIQEITALGAELATTAAGAILRKGLSPEDHRRIVAESLEEIRRHGGRTWAN